MASLLAIVIQVVYRKFCSLCIASGRSTSDNVQQISMSVGGNVPNGLVGVERVWRGGPGNLN